MRKIIHSKFELDLSSLNITDTEQNHWFSDSIFSKYSLPFTINLTDETAALFNFLDEYNVSNFETLFEVIYVHYDIMTKAIFEIENLDDGKLSCTIRYGFDEFPNFHKKLSELPLQVLEVDDIYQHAKTVITKAYPVVNYNFPQIHVDKIDDPEDDETWFAFENILNNYKDGEFLENEVDELEEITYNRNIMQPLPYLLHVLKAGFAEQNYELKGSFSEHPLIKKLLLYSEREYYKNNIPDSIELGLMFSEDDYKVSEQELSFTGMYGNLQYIWKKFERTAVIPLKGKYRISGDVVLTKVSPNSSANLISQCKVFFNDVLVYHYVHNPSSFGINGINRKTINIDVEIETPVDTVADEVRIEVSTTDFNFESDNISLQIHEIVSDTSVNPIIMHDESGEVIPSVRNENKVDLPRAVPDMTFGELVTMLKNWFNLDFTPKGNEIWIDFLEENINYSDTFDLSAFEVPRPYIGFQKGMSFVLRFQEIESDTYKFPPVYQSYNTITNEGFVKDDKTNEINVNAVPLPLVYRREVLTAHSFLKDESKPFFVLYNGLVDGLNLTENNTELQMPNIHELFWRKWFNFRINATLFKWTFKANFEDLIGLRKKAFAYRNYHFIKSINKTETSPDEFEIEIETEVLK